MVPVSLGSRVFLDLEVRRWAQTSPDPLVTLACPVWMESMGRVDLKAKPAPRGPVRTRETEVIPGSRASPAPRLRRENQEFPEAPVTTVAQGSREREASPATTGVPA